MSHMPLGNKFYLYFYSLYQSKSGLCGVLLSKPHGDYAGAPSTGGRRALRDVAWVDNDSRCSGTVGLGGRGIAVTKDGGEAQDSTTWPRLHSCVQCRQLLSRLPHQFVRSERVNMITISYVDHHFTRLPLKTISVRTCTKLQ